MTKKLSTGIKGHSEFTVTEAMTAEALGSGLLPVFSTPSLVAMMENTCSNSVLEYMEEGCGTVGTALDIKHTAATPVGMKVYADSELIEIDGRRLVFNVRAYDECGEIGHGRHERFIIDNARFMAKVSAKADRGGYHPPA